MHSTRFPFEDFDSGQSQEGFVDTPLSPETQKNVDPSSSVIANENAQNVVKEPEKVFSAEDLDSAKKLSFLEGKAAGFIEGKTAALAEINASQEQLNKKISVLLESLNIQLVTLFDTTAQYNPAYFRPFIHQLAFSIAKKVVGGSIKEENNSQIEAHIDHSLGLLFDQPKLTIYLHPELEAPLMDRIQELAVKNNFRGEIVIKPDSTLMETDCKLDWHEGFSEISKEDLLNAIQKILETA